MELCLLDGDTCGKYAVCGYSNPAAAPYKSKSDWLRGQFSSGLRHIVLLDEEGKAVGGIEYAPSETAWRPVSAPGMILIHCVYITSKKYKGAGFGRMMLEHSIADAKENGFAGVAVVARKGSWMAGPDLFLSSGFSETDSASPDFKLLFLPLKNGVEKPVFSGSLAVAPEERAQGLVLYWSEQCPYLTKSVAEIVDYAKKENIDLDVIKMESPLDVRKSPCAFGTFCITWKGRLVAVNPVSRTRFRNIVEKCN